MSDAVTRFLSDLRPDRVQVDRIELHVGPSPLEQASGTIAVLAPLSARVRVVRAGTALLLDPGDVVVLVGPGSVDVSPAEPEDGPAALVRGAHPVHGSVCDRVLTGLPGTLVVRRTEATDALLRLVEAEHDEARLGQATVTDHLVGLLLVVAVREWLDDPASTPPAWHAAQRDPVVGRALRCIHDHPARPWTVASLAAQAAASRAAFARRFTAVVGEPPISYLACWRLCLAAELLERTDATVDAVAREVGYANGYSLGVAFKRAHGRSPGQHRRQARRR